MAEISPNGNQTLSEKEKLLVTSNFSFSDSVFKTCAADTENKWLFWERFKIKQLHSSAGTYLQYSCFRYIAANHGFPRFVIFPQITCYFHIVKIRNIFKKDTQRGNVFTKDIRRNLIDKIQWSKSMP